MGSFSDLAVTYKIYYFYKIYLISIKSVDHKIMDTFPRIRKLWQLSYFDYIGVRMVSHHDDHKIMDIMNRMSIKRYKIRGLPIKLRIVSIFFYSMGPNFK